MEIWLMWIIAGFVLGIAELITGTFYLLVLGAGAFAGAVVAYAGGNEIVQAIVACIVALVGAYLVHSRHVRNRASTRTAATSSTVARPWCSNWVDEGARVARVSIAAHRGRAPGKPSGVRHRAARSTSNRRKATPWWSPPRRP
jgi:hypothetical protein